MIAFAVCQSSHDEITQKLEVGCSWEHVIIAVIKANLFAIPAVTCVEVR